MFPPLLSLTPIPVLFFKHRGPVNEFGEPHQLPGSCADRAGWDWKERQDKSSEHVAIPSGISPGLLITCCAWASPRSTNS